MAVEACVGRKSNVKDAHLLSIGTSSEDDARWPGAKIFKRFVKYVVEGFVTDVVGCLADSDGA